jgi:hypothetical protein
MYFWEGYLGFWSMPLSLVLFIVYFSLVFKFLKHFIKIIDYKFKNKKRVFLTIAMLILLVVMFLFPNGIIKVFEKNVLVAYQEGVAGCGTILKLHTNNKFVMTTYCFGLREIKGNYKYTNDTIYFYNQSNDKLRKYDFGIIEKGNSGEFINLYQTDNDTVQLSYFLYVKINKLKSI